MSTMTDPAPETPEAPHDGADGPEDAPGTTGTPPEPDEPDEGAETFPRAYVERLRRESAGYRTRAEHADGLAERLLAATVREATAGLLADPSDLVVTAADVADDDGYPDPDRIAQAARDLVARKPHLGDRRPRGDVGQGSRGDTPTVNLAGMLRQAAG